MNRLSPFGRLSVAGAAAATAAFCALVLIAPTAERFGWWGAPWARLALAPTCHQIAERCLDLGHGPLPVCARCAGLWAGGLIGLIASLVSGRRVRPALIWIAVAAAPSVIDFGLGFLGAPTLANWPRFIVAVLPGALLGLLVADVLDDVVGDARRDGVE